MSLPYAGSDDILKAALSKTERGMGMQSIFASLAARMPTFLLAGVKSVSI